jgi:hypothetical protein
VCIALYQRPDKGLRTLPAPKSTVLCAVFPFPFAAQTNTR